MMQGGTLIEKATLVQKAVHTIAATRQTQLHLENLTLLVAGEADFHRWMTAEGPNQFIQVVKGNASRCRAAQVLRNFLL